MGLGLLVCDGGLYGCGLLTMLAVVVRCVVGLVLVF